jgi:hypothetical protein
VIFVHENIDLDKITIEKSRSPQTYIMKLYDDEFDTLSAMAITKPKLIEMAKAILKELGEESCNQ